jgi:hypothetical protein
LVDKMAQPRVEDAIAAQAAARRYLTALYGLKKIKEVSFSRAWYQTGALRDVWEVEGDAVVKKGWFSKEQKHFKFQIDPVNGRVISHEM